MELKVENLRAKADALKAESMAYATKEQQELTDLNTQLQSLQSMISNKLKEAQRKIDIDAGKLSGLEDLIKEMGSEPKDEPATTD